VLIFLLCPGFLFSRSTLPAVVTNLSQQYTVAEVFVCSERDTVCTPGPIYSLFLHLISSRLPTDPPTFCPLWVLKIFFLTFWALNFYFIRRYLETHSKVCYKIFYGQMLWIPIGWWLTSVHQRVVETACTVLGGCAICPRVDRWLNTGRVCDTVLLQTYSVYMYMYKSAVCVGEHMIYGPCCC
jgi:hypothetical protein